MAQGDKKDEVLDLRRSASEGRPDTPARGEVSWQAEEFAWHEKEPQWFLVGGIVALGVFLSLVILKNVFGAATILLFAVIIYLYAAKKPDTLNVTVDARGISVSGKLTPYSSIASFWVLFEPPTKDLILIHKARFAPKMIIPLGNANPLEVREMLLANAIPEKEEEESLVDIIARRLGF